MRITSLLLVLFAIAGVDMGCSPCAAQENDDNVVWRIGKTDDSSIEFAPGSQLSVTYKVGEHDVSEHFPGFHDGTETWMEEINGEKPYHIEFELGEQPSGDMHLEVHLRFLNGAPTHLQVSINDRKGIVPIIPQPAAPLDSIDGNMVLLSRADLVVPIPGKWLQESTNRISLVPLGFGSMHYDSLVLRRGTATVGEVLQEPTLVPSLFYVRREGQLLERCSLLIPFDTPLEKGSAVIHLGERKVEIDDLEIGDFSFGVWEHMVNVPAHDGDVTARIEVAWNDQTLQATQRYTPARRWKLFFCPKVHNDVGYTDLQPHVNELDTRNTDTILSILKKFPFYKFNFESSWLVENYLDCRTEASRQELFDRSREGRAAFNAFYLNLLTGVCTGEELYRSLYYTQRLHREQGTNFDFACLTDAPSHTWFLPTMLEDVGIKGFANGSNQGRAPILVLGDLNDQSPFYWEGLNGERTLMFYARSYAQWKMLTSSGYIGPTASYDYLKNTLPQFLVRYARSEYAPDAVMAYGAYIDNAAIPETGEAEYIERWNEEFAYPQLLVTTDAEYFDYIEKNFADKLPVYRGDAGAYWEDGVASSAEATNWNRATKQLLPLAETSCSFATLFEPRYRYPSEAFHDTWKNVLFYDEHTWGAFNSTSQPQREGVQQQWEVKESYARRANLDARNLLARSLNRLCEQFTLDDSTILAFNWQNRTRSQVLETELGAMSHLVEIESNQAVPVEVIHEEKDWSRVRFLAQDIPPMGYRGYAIRMLDAKKENEETTKPAEQAAANAEESWSIENEHYRLEIDPQSGGIRSLSDKHAQRELVDQQASYRLNEYLYVTGGGDDTLMPNLAYGKPPAELQIHKPGRAQVIERVASPLGKRIVVKTSGEHTPAIRCEYVLHDHVKRLDIVNTVQKDSVLEKEAVYFAFPFSAQKPRFEYQIQNGWLRPNVDQLPGACKEWFSPQNVVHLQDADFSVAWASPDAPLMTLIDINRGRWLKELEVNNGHLFSYVMNNYWWTNYRAEQSGKFTFRYSITSGTELSRQELAAFDVDSRAPVFPYAKLSNFSARVSQVDRRLPASSGSLMELADPNLQVIVLKRAEDGKGWIVRLQEIAGQTGSAQLRLPHFAIEAAQLCNGVEVDKQPLEHTAEAVTIPYEPYRFITVRLHLSDPLEVVSVFNRRGIR